MIRVVVEVPETLLRRTEKDAVWFLRCILNDARHPELARRVKSFTRVRAGDRAKLVGVDDIGTKLRRLRDELNVIIGDAT